MRNIILFTLCVFLLTSCGCSKETPPLQTLIEHSDSTVIREIVRFDTLYFPAESAAISVPVDDLKNGYTKDVKNGRATATVKVKDNVLDVTADCSELEKIIALKDKEIQRFIKEKSITVLKPDCKRTNSKFATFCIWYSFLLTAVIGVFTYFKFKSYVTRS